MKTRGATLVELVVAMCIAAIIATIAGTLLLKGLESWRREADRESAVRRATLATDKMAQDLSAQPDWPDLTAPVSAFELTGQGAYVAFFMTGKDTRETSICWYLSGDTPSTLRCYEADAAETETSLPGNAAGLKVASVFKDAEGDSMDALESASLKWCEGVCYVKMVTRTGDIPQIILKTLTPEGRKLFVDGKTIDSLPERCLVDVARPVHRLGN